MIQEQYVDLKTARLLRRKKFNEECRAEYFKDDDGQVYFSLCGIETDHDICTNKDLKELCFGKQRFYAAPTLQMVMQWLREVHKIHVDIIIEGNGSCIKYYSNIRPFKIMYPTRFGDSIDTIKIGTYNTYEEAVKAAIKYCLENLI